MRKLPPKMNEYQRVNRSEIPRIALLYSKCVRIPNMKVPWGNG